MSQNEPSTYWISSSQLHISGPYDIPNKYFEEYYDCNLSLIFDEGSHRHFSGFHLRIVADEETARHWQLIDVFELSASHAYRRPLKYCKAALQHLTLPLCPIIARVSVTGNSSLGFTRISNYPPSIEYQSGGSLSFPETDSIIYESIHFCPPGTRGETMILKFKDPRYSTWPRPTYLTTTKNAELALSSLRNVYITRVLPLAPPKVSAANSLPLQLWDRIVKLAIELSEPRWAGSFLESTDDRTHDEAPWHRLRNLFWEKIGGGHKALISHPVQVAQNIIREPGLGRYITHFTLDNFVWAPEGVVRAPRAPSEHFDSNISLLLQQVADNLRVCQLDTRILLEDILPKTRCLVQRLKNIEHLSVNLGLPGLFAEGVHDIQNLIRGWRRIKHLSLTGARPNWGRNEKTSRVPDSPLYMLNSLKIKSSSLFGNQLLHFVPIATHKLRHAYLFQITELSNAALRTFLSVTCRTLTTLTVASCTVELAGEHEERAVDAIIPSMKKLRKLTVQEDLISSKTLSRGSSDTGIYDIDIYPTTLRIWRISHIFAKRLPELIPSVRWDEMVVTYAQRDSTRSESLTEAQQIAGNISLPFRIVPHDEKVEP